MKLTIKHLAPYLPYRLKISHTTYSEYGRHKTIIVEVESLHKECVTFSEGMDYYFEDPEDNECSIKPILRPLSDLTKEIEHNGERFVPLKRLQININWYNLEQWKSDHRLMNVAEYNNLLSWHFDIFGLIDADLAIDINTI